MAGVSSFSSQESVDIWDQPSSSTTRRVTTAAPVPDDWENDDDDDETNDEENRRIWEDANAKAPNPMPAVIMASSSTTSRTVLPSPPGAFQPTMRILKRPTGSNSTPSTPPTSASAETLKEREARYQAARERIFGEDGAARDSSSTSLSSPKGQKERKSPTPNQSASAAAVVRNPKGPAETLDAGTGGRTSSRGFGERRTKPPSIPNDTRGEPAA